MTKQEIVTGTAAMHELLQPQPNAPTWEPASYQTWYDCWSTAWVTTGLLTLGSALVLFSVAAG